MASPIGFDIRDVPTLTKAIADAVTDDSIQQLTELLNTEHPSRHTILLNNVSIKGRPLMHHAVLNNQIEMVNFLIRHGVDECLLNTSGRTALHEAVRLGNVPLVKMLLQKNKSCDEIDGLSGVELAFGGISSLAQTGHLVNMKDQGGLTPLLLLSDAATVTAEEFTELVQILLIAGANVGLVHPASGQNALFRAVELEALRACEDLVGAGVEINWQDISGDTVLHIAARQDNLQILEFLVKCSNNSVNAMNAMGDTPLHCAALSGSRRCLSILLNFGGDLSIENNEYLTVLDVMFTHVPRPATFLIEHFDSKVTANQCSLNDRRFQMTLDFRILSPDRDRQMSIVVALMNVLRTIDKKKILQHPLVETYLRLKWKRMQRFFFGFFVIHLLFVISLSIHILSLLYPDNASGITWSRRVLLGTATIIIIHILAQSSFAPRYFFREPETWLGLICVCLAFFMSLSGEFFSETCTLDNDWIRHIASFTVLLSWGQLMFILGRFPVIGFFAMMFFQVFKNVLKVLLILVCLVIGFALSFCVQFNSFEYEGAGKSILRTIVMLMGEYNYETLFKEDGEDGSSLGHRRWKDQPNYLFITSQLIFVLFIFLGSVVLMNLLIGMAVNDIQGIQAEGNLRHMIKQAEFLLHVDNIFSRSRYFQKRKTISSIITINPSSLVKIKKRNYKRLGLYIPSILIERLVMLAVKNQRKDNGGMSSATQVKVVSIDQEYENDEYSS